MLAAAEDGVLAAQGQLGAMLVEGFGGTPANPEEATLVQPAYTPSVAVALQGEDTGDERESVCSFSSTEVAPDGRFYVASSQDSRNFQSDGGYSSSEDS